jgi:hypothetical protein
VTKKVVVLCIFVRRFIYYYYKMTTSNNNVLSTVTRVVGVHMMELPLIPHVFVLVLLTLELQEHCQPPLFIVHRSLPLFFLVAAFLVFLRTWVDELLTC